MISALLGSYWGLGGSLGLPWDLLGGDLGLSWDSLGAPWLPPGALLGPVGLPGEPVGSQGSPKTSLGIIFGRFGYGFLRVCDDD